MMDLVFNNSTKSKKFTSRFFKKILNQASSELHLKFGLGLSVNLVSQAKIKSLNKKYRHQNKATDVLSFPLHDLSSYQKKNHGVILELGDIFICPDFVNDKIVLQNRGSQIRQRRIGITHKTKLASEMKFLTVHGFLHLLGYDHEKSKTEEKKMFQLQNKILNKL